MLLNDYSYADGPGRDAADVLGMCVYGDDKDAPTMETFDGEFEGLIPRPAHVALRQFGHSSLNLICNYAQAFDDIPPS